MQPPQPDLEPTAEEKNTLPDPVTARFWIEAFRELTLSRDILGLRILEKVYVSPGHPYVLDWLVKELRFITRSKSTVYYRLRRLHDMGLVDLVRGRPVVVWPKRDVESEVVRQLVASAARRLGVFYGRR
jgi:DNA-binding transcriptional ArsR family regulator